MHYCLTLITKELPSEEEIGLALERFNEEEIYKDIEDENGNITCLYDGLTKQEKMEKYPFTWDWWQVGGRYGGRIKYKIQEDDYKFYNHNICNKKFKSQFFDDIQKYYQSPFGRSIKTNEIDECDFVQYLGLCDDFIYCDGAKIQDIQNIEHIKDDFGYCIYDSINDIAYARKVWNGDTYIETENYAEKVRNIIENNADGFLTIIDIHN